MQQVPVGDRLEGLSILSRRLLQAVVDIQNLAGPAAIKLLKVILCVDEDQEKAVRELVSKQKFYGLNPEHFFMIKIPRFPGVIHDMVC